MERRLTSFVAQNLCRFGVCDVLILTMFKKITTACIIHRTVIQSYIVNITVFQIKIIKFKVTFQFQLLFQKGTELHFITI